MPFPPVYSERLILATLPTVPQYTVPAGKRAIVKFISAYNQNATATPCGLAIGASYVWEQTIPGAQAIVTTGAHVAVYAGETMKFTAGLANVSCCASGYLLDAPVGQREPGTLPAPGEPPPLTPLPSPSPR